MSLLNQGDYNMKEKVAAYMEVGNSFPYHKTRSKHG